MILVVNGSTGPLPGPSGAAAGGPPSFVGEGSGSPATPGRHSARASAWLGCHGFEALCKPLYGGLQELGALLGIIAC